MEKKTNRRRHIQGRVVSIFEGGPAEERKFQIKVKEEAQYRLCASSICEEEEAKIRVKDYVIYDFNTGRIVRHIQDEQRIGKKRKRDHNDDGRENFSKLQKYNDLVENKDIVYLVSAEENALFRSSTQKNKYAEILDLRIEEDDRIFKIYLKKFAALINKEKGETRAVVFPFIATKKEVSRFLAFLKRIDAEKRHLECLYEGEYERITSGLSEAIRHECIDKGDFNRIKKVCDYYGFFEKALADLLVTYDGVPGSMFNFRDGRENMSPSKLPLIQSFKFKTTESLDFYREPRKVQSRDSDFEYTVERGTGVRVPGRVNIKDFIESGIIDEEIIQLAGRVPQFDDFITYAYLINLEKFDRISSALILKRDLTQYVVGKAERGDFNTWFDRFKKKSKSIELIKILIWDHVKTVKVRNQTGFRSYCASIREENLLKMALRLECYSRFGRNADGIPVALLKRKHADAYGLTIKLDRISQNIPEGYNIHVLLNNFLYLVDMIPGFEFYRYKAKRISLCLDANELNYIPEALLYNKRLCERLIRVTLRNNFINILESKNTKMSHLLTVEKIEVVRN